MATVRYQSIKVKGGKRDVCLHPSSPSLIDRSHLRLAHGWLLFESCVINYRSRSIIHETHDTYKWLWTVVKKQSVERATKYQSRLLRFTSSGWFTGSPNHQKSALNPMEGRKAHFSCPLSSVFFSPFITRFFLPFSHFLNYFFTSPFPTLSVLLFATFLCCPFWYFLFLYHPLLPRDTTSCLLDFFLLVVL